MARQTGRSSFEQLWLRLWIMFAIAGLFVLVSYAGIWPLSGDAAHIALLALFGVGTIAAIVHMIRVPWPSRDDAIRRIERVSGVPHRPASSYEDTLSAPASDPATLALWRAHRERMAALLKRLKAGKPQPAHRSPRSVRGARRSRPSGRAADGAWRRPDVRASRLGVPSRLFGAAGGGTARRLGYAADLHRACRR